MIAGESRFHEPRVHPRRRASPGGSQPLVQRRELQRTGGPGLDPGTVGRERVPGGGRAGRACRRSAGGLPALAGIDPAANRPSRCGCPRKWKLRWPRPACGWASFLVRWYWLRNTCSSAWLPPNTIRRSGSASTAWTRVSWKSRSTFRAGARAIRCRRRKAARATRRQTSPAISPNRSRKSPLAPAGVLGGRASCRPCWREDPGAPRLGCGRKSGAGGLAGRGGLRPFRPRRPAPDGPAQTAAARLTGLLGRVSLDERLQARETQSDVGTAPLDALRTPARKHGRRADGQFHAASRVAEEPGRVR